MGALTGEIALVTGATSGIGAAIARRFAAEGASVAVHGRDQTRADAVCAAIVDQGGRALPVIGDLTEEDVASRLVGITEEALGPIGIAVANAGGDPVPPGPIENMSLSQWRAVVDGNLTMTFLTVAAVLPGMKARGRGSIITISSAASRRPTVHTPAAYAAAKAGTEVLTRMVALQAGPSGVRANCIAPETILTDGNANRIPAEVQLQMANVHAIRRLGAPDDVAAAAVYLASDEAAWTTGIVLDVAGGSVLA